MGVGLAGLTWEALSRKPWGLFFSSRQGVWQREGERGGSLLSYQGIAKEQRPTNQQLQCRPTEQMGLAGYNLPTSEPDSLPPPLAPAKPVQGGESHTHFESP